MADFVRLTQTQKEQFNEIYNAYGSSYELNVSSKLNDEFENAADKLSIEPSGQYVLISKPEVHPRFGPRSAKQGLVRLRISITAIPIQTIEKQGRLTLICLKHF